MRALDTVLKVTMAAAVVTASAGVAYYYATYLPQRDAALDAQRALDAEYASRLQAEQEMRAELGKATIDAILKGLAVYGAQFDTLDDVN